MLVFLQSMVKAAPLVPVVAVAFRLVVLVMPLPLLMGASSPSAGCTSSDIKVWTNKLATVGAEQDKAIGVLSQCKDADAVKLLVAELKSNSSVQVRSALVEVLKQIGIPTIDELVKLLADPNHSEVAQSLAIDVLADIAKAKQSASSETIKSVLQARVDDPQESDLVRINAAQALRQINHPPANIKIQKLILDWSRRNPISGVVIVIIFGVAIAYPLAWWFKPLWLLGIPATLKIPHFNIDLPVGVLHWLKYRPRVLNEWVKENLDRSKEYFENKEKRLELDPDKSLQPVYIPLALETSGNRTFYSSSSQDEEFALFLKEEIFENQECLVIVGVAGAGKSSLACQIARWNAGWKTGLHSKEGVLWKHRMLPVFISWDLEVSSKSEEATEATILLDSIRRLLPNPKPDRELLKRLLEQQKILVIIDRFSELDEKTTQKQIKEAITQIPIHALIITSRQEDLFNDIGHKILEPKRLTGLSLGNFISKYLEQRGTLSHFQGDKDSIIERFKEKLQNEIKTELEDATVLLTRMYLDQVHEALSKHQLKGLTEESVEELTRKIQSDFFELIHQYLIRLNDTVKSRSANKETESRTNYRENEDVEKCVKAIALICLESNAYQPRPVRHEKVINELVKLDKADSVDQDRKRTDARELIKYLNESLRLLEISGVDEVKISLDPLAEHFAALQVVDNCQASDNVQEIERQWSELIDKLRTSSGKGFLKALRKRCEAVKNVPRFAIDALDELIEPDEEKRKEAQQKRRLQRAIADLKDIDLKYRTQAIVDLREMGTSAKPAVPYLLDVLENQREDLQLRRSVPEILRKISPDAAQVSTSLIPLLENQNEDLQLRRSLINVLVELDKTQQTAEPVLGRILKDSNEVLALRLCSLRGLRQWGKSTSDWTATVNDDDIQICELKPSPQVWIENSVEGLHLGMVEIPAGSFLMGSPEGKGEKREYPQHNVTIAQPFWMGKYPVTQAQWQVVAGWEKIKVDLDPEPAYFRGSDRPVEQVSWYEAVEFCNRLSQHFSNPKMIFRLPSEAEWEYACRAGTETPYHFGETVTEELANFSGRNTPNETTPVGQYGVANRFGLYDMHGNVWEWCADHCHDSYEEAPTDGSAWVTENEGTKRLMRGGSWYDSPGDCRSAYRNYDVPDYLNINIGFRVVCVLA